ncbi:M12 family metallopeptidase [Pseudomonas sp. N3-W]|uniref:M12 family metallopeptidase n=1 Tax=Pseudomonas sp. N3-W TaxID=2975049 RepID=UPI00217D90C7|nr:M12 family metallopeptidase [Pseudomonas sp. N3-W]UWF50472.1 M12 family metallopeptidase [Pseudomonas sp. N3-W]
MQSGPSQTSHTHHEFKFNFIQQHFKLTFKPNNHCASNKVQSNASKYSQPATKAHCLKTWKLLMTPTRPCIIEHPADILASYDAAITENPANAPLTPSNRKKRSVGTHTKYWKPGRTLKIAIPDFGDELVQAVKDGINTWQPHVNLHFHFIELPDNDELYEGDIRINLSPLSDGTGSSHIGTDALNARPHHTTMTLGTDHTSSYFKYTVIHEFGHALGLMHEHQHPDANIPWNKEKTYTLYKLKFGWSKALVDANLFPADRQSQQSYTPYDRHSVMHYPVSSDYTLGGWEQTLNTRLSAADIAFAQKIYPK